MIKKPHGHLAVRIFCALQRRCRCATLRKTKEGRIWKRFSRRTSPASCERWGWSSSVPNLSGKLKRGSLRYGEAVELADALEYDIVWQKR